MDTGLLPCPFCGGTAVEGYAQSAVICNDCNAHGPITPDGNFVELWNRRVVIEAASAGAEYCRRCGQSADTCAKEQTYGDRCCIGCTHNHSAASDVSAGHSDGAAASAETAALTTVAAPSESAPAEEPLNFAPPNSTRTVAVTVTRVDDPPVLEIDAQPEAPSVPMGVEHGEK